MNTDLIRILIDKTVAAIDAAADDLTRLDQAIGDGDHGINMRRGFHAMGTVRDEIAALEPADALVKAGSTLVMSVGGASGPLYGSLLMGMGKAAKAGKDFAEQLADGVAAVKQRGKSDAGAKTMLDVLVPVVEAVRAGLSPAEIQDVAMRAREATKDMVATRGRASFLKERSRGHYDPGATSSQILISVVCEVLENPH